MKKIFTILIVIFPIIAVYRSPIPGVDMATCLMLLFSFLFLIFHRDAVVDIKNPFLFFLIYLVIFSIASYLIQGSSDAIVFLRMGKFVFLILFAVIIARGSFDQKLGIRVLTIITAAATVYIIVQAIAYYTGGILLPAGFLSVVTDETYGGLDYMQIARSFYRPSSFFIEPAYFAQYTLLGLCVNLFGYGQRKYRYVLALFFTAGIVLSGSGQGVLAAAFLWGLAFMQRLVFTNFTIKKLFLTIVICVACVVFIPMLLKTSFVSMTLARIFGDNAAMGGNALLSRLEGYRYFSTLPAVLQIIGTGYGNVPVGVYLSSAAYTLYTLGILGAGLVLYIFADAFSRGKGFQRVFTAAYFVLFLAANVFTATYICFYFCFLYIGRADNVQVPQWGDRRRFA